MIRNTGLNLHLKTLTVGLHTATQSLLGQKQRLLINKKFRRTQKSFFHASIYPKTCYHYHLFSTKAFVFSQFVPSLLKKAIKPHLSIQLNLHTFKSRIRLVSQWQLARDGGILGCEICSGQLSIYNSAAKQQISWRSPLTFV